jgi:hypothetical protein
MGKKADMRAIDDLWFATSSLTATANENHDEDAIEPVRTHTDASRAPASDLSHVV